MLFIQIKDSEFCRKSKYSQHFIYSTNCWVFFMIKSVLLLLGRGDRNLPGEKLKEKNDKMILANRGWMLFSRGWCSVRFRCDFFLMRFFFSPVWSATGLLGAKWAKRWMAEEKELSSGWEGNHFRSIVDEQTEQAVGLPGATPVFMIFKGGWHACRRNHKMLIVTEPYGQAYGDTAAFLLLHRQVDSSEFYWNPTSMVEEIRQNSISFKIDLMSKSMPLYWQCCCWMYHSPTLTSVDVTMVNNSQNMPQRDHRFHLREVWRWLWTHLLHPTGNVSHSQSGSAM